MKTSHMGVLLVALALVAGPAAAADQSQNGAVNEILQVLKDRGIVNQTQYNRMAEQNAAYEQQHQQSTLPTIEWSGDFRFRHESFWYRSDALGNNHPDRNRIRYRFRLNGKVNINEYADVFFRLRSGNDPRSGNQTLGGDLPDFNPDQIRIALAYARLTAPADWTPLNGKLVMELGKVPNPFIGNVTPDLMLWDHDFTLEGASVRYTARPWEGSEIFANAGYYIIQENSSKNDPHLWAIQVGGSQEATKDVTFGGRATYYSFNSINNQFLVRGSTGVGTIDAGGNIPNGLVGSDGPMRVIEAAGYVKFGGVENWPMALFADYSHNLEAASSAAFNAGKDADAWNVSFEIGDKKKYAKLGVGWWHIESNAFPSMYIDSDLLDGKTNREGLMIWASRQLMKNTDLNLTLFDSSEIDSKVALAQGIKDARRVRLQADMVFKF